MICTQLIGIQGFDSVLHVPFMVVPYTQAVPDKSSLVWCRLRVPIAYLHCKHLRYTYSSPWSIHVVDTGLYPAPDSQQLKRLMKSLYKIGRNGLKPEFMAST